MLRRKIGPWSNLRSLGRFLKAAWTKRRDHAYGAHFTSELDILKVVLPTIVRPWRERIDAANTLRDLLEIRRQLLDTRILDPACGSGNFLYVAFRELKRLELAIIGRVHDEFGKKARRVVGSSSRIEASQFFGIDIKPFAVELAKITLMLAKKLALDEAIDYLDTHQIDLPLEFESALPLDNLDQNIVCGDALFMDWPHATAIVGNPPFQSKDEDAGRIWT